MNQQEREERREQREFKTRRKSLAVVVIRDGRLIWQPTDYTKDYLGLGEIDCGAVQDPSAERAIDQAYERAHRARKAFRGGRKLEKQTLSPEQYRRKRNHERAELLLRRREDPGAA
jgi:hypothetical protein